MALPDLLCSTCGYRAAVAEREWRCKCGGLFDVAPFGPEAPDRRDLAGRPATMWRYGEALPVSFDAGISMGEGLTPLVPAPGVPGALMKLDYLMPTLSFKDRGASVLATLAKQLGARVWAVDSSGNAGTAMAAYAARAGAACEVFVPGGTSEAKLAQMRAHGADVRIVGPARQDAADAAMARVSDGQGCFYASHVYNPYFLHGTKTFAYELWEQCPVLPPAACLLPAGNGTLVIGAYLGFSELVAQGLWEKIPAIIAVQAAACAPLATAFAAGAAGPLTVEAGPTVAEGIAIALPPRGAQVLDAVRRSGGTFVTVDDDETGQAQFELAHHGFFVEPTSAVCWAALRRSMSGPRPEWLPAGLGPPGHGPVVLPLCGAGLKAVHT